MSSITDKINSATLDHATAWEAEIDRFVFCIDFLEISASHSRADHWVDQLELVFEGLIEQRDAIRAQQKAITKAARFDAGRSVLTVWLSPNMFGERPCRSMAEARRIVAFTGIAQSIVREEA
jgi:hypothetical protein